MKLRYNVLLVLLVLFLLCLFDSSSVYAEETNMFLTKSTFMNNIGKDSNNFDEGLLKQSSVGLFAIYTNDTFSDMNVEEFTTPSMEFLRKASVIEQLKAVPEETPPIETPQPTEEPNKIQMGDFETTKGVFQGPWGDLTEYANQLQGNRGSKTRELLSHVGTIPINEGASNYLYDVDRWREINGKGVVRYSQGGAQGEEWNSLSSGDSTLVGSACGAYSTACVLSTMLGKYINVPEVAIAVNTYELRHQGSNLILSNSDGDSEGAFKHTDLAAVIEECGLKTKVADNFDVNMVDDCLNNGGMVIYVVNGNYGGRYTRNAHYIVIREKTDKGYLVYSSTNWSSSYDDDYCNTENTVVELQNLQGYNGAQMVFVTYP